MVGLEQVMEIRVLHRHGKGIREIARETGLSRKTVRRDLRSPDPPRYKRRPASRARVSGAREGHHGCAPALSIDYITVMSDGLDHLHTVGLMTNSAIEGERL
jgi:IS30 family transposase